MNPELVHSDSMLRVPRVIRDRCVDFGSGRVRKDMPGIECAKNGRLWVTWRTRVRYQLSRQPGETSDAPGSTVHLITSGDNGRTWTPMLTIEPPVAGVSEYAACVWIDPIGQLRQHWCQGLLMGGSDGLWCMTADDARSAQSDWTQPRRLFDGMMPNKPVVLSCGTWIIATTVSVPTAITGHLMAQCNIHASTDQGTSWTKRGGLDVPEGSHLEPMIVERRDGSLWMLVRTGGEVRPGEHMPRGIAESISRDGGATWSPARMTNIAGPSSRFFLRRLRCGRLLLINHRGFDPDDTERIGRTHLTASLSDDEGVTWSSHLLIDGVPPLSAAQPDSTQAADGRIYVIHNRVSPGGNRHMILHCLTTADIDAGRIVTSDCYLGRVVNGSSDSTT